MKLTSRFGYAEGGSLQVLQMPYLGRQVAMTILLLREVEGLGDLEAALTPDNLEAWTRDLETTQVAVSLPRFEMTYELDLKDTLIGLGVRDAFRVDIGVAVTGIAGPSGGSDEKPVGFVCIAVAGEEDERVKEFNFDGSREEIKAAAAKAALELACEFLSEQ